MAIVAASSLGLMIGAGAALPALADPTTPSQAQVDAAQAAAAGAAGQVSAVQAQLDAASAALDAAQVQASKAAEAFDAAQEQLADRTAAAQAAQAAADGARATATQARTAVGRLAAGTYRSGGGLSDLSAFLSADGPQDMLDRAALLDSVSQQQDRTFQKAAAAQSVAGLLQGQAQAALAQQQAAAAAADAARRSAQASADSAQSLVASTQARQGELVAQLAQLQGISVSLAQQRQDGLQREAQARAEAAARARIEAQQKAEAQASASRASSSTRASSASSGSAGASSGSSGSAKGPAATTPAPVSGGSSQGSASAGSSALAWARTQIGKPYVWGATGPDSYDCSGLTSKAWAAAGVTIPRTSSAQYSRVKKISYDDMRPGDLIFYGDDPDDASTVYHVAIYAGGGRMVEAPHTGADVREVAVRYSQAMTWAGRP